MFAVLSARLAFFDATPPGRLMNRFSRDQYAIDESLPFQLNIFLAQSGGLLGTLLVLAYTTEGVFVVVLPFLGVAYFFVQVCTACLPGSMRLIEALDSHVYHCIPKFWIHRAQFYCFCD